MHILGLEFRPGLWATMVTLVLAGILVGLGNWQMDRAKTKQHAQQRYDELGREPAVSLPVRIVRPDSLEYRRVEAEGAFDSRYQIYVDNRVHDGVAGLHVLAPLRVRGSATYVLVNRGWVAWGATRSQLPQVDVPQPPVHISGVAVIPSARFMELSGEQKSSPVWQNLDMEQYRKFFPFALQGVVILQQNDTGDTLVRDWPRPDTGAAKHVGYAYQWYAFALTLFVIYIVLNVKRA
jgi:surfeit locus 1 family protein